MKRVTIRDVARAARVIQYSLETSSRLHVFVRSRVRRGTHSRIIKEPSVFTATMSEV